MQKNPTMSTSNLPNFVARPFTLPYFLELRVNPLFKIVIHFKVPLQGKSRGSNFKRNRTKFPEEPLIVFADFRYLLSF